MSSFISSCFSFFYSRIEEESEESKCRKKIRLCIKYHLYTYTTYTCEKKGDKTICLKYVNDLTVDQHSCRHFNDTELQFIQFINNNFSVDNIQKNINTVELNQLINNITDVEFMKLFYKNYVNSKKFH